MHCVSVYTEKLQKSPSALETSRGGGQGRSKAQSLFLLARRQADGLEL